MEFNKLTDIIPKEILSLLLAGICERLQAPALLYQKDPQEKFIYPVERDRRYPNFCKRLRNLKGEDICLRDSQDRAEKVLKEKKPSCEVCKWGIISCCVPITIVGRVLAVCSAGKFVEAKETEKIIERARDLSDQEKRELKKALAQDKEIIKNQKDQEEFQKKLQAEIAKLEDVLWQYLQRRYLEKWEEILNTISILDERGLKEIKKLLEEIREVFQVPWLIVFLATNPGERVIKPELIVSWDNFNQTKLGKEPFHYNWKKGKIEEQKELKSLMKGDDFFENFLKGLKGPGAEEVKKDAFFVTPYIFGDKYRGLFLVSKPKIDFQSNKAKKRLFRFLADTGYLLIARLLSLRALETLTARQEWHDLMVRVWAHSIRSQLQDLISSYEEIKEAFEKLNLPHLPFDKKEIAEEIDKIHKVAKHLGQQAKLAVQAPEAAITAKIKEPPQLKRVDLPTLLYYCANAFEEMAKRKNMEIKIKSTVDGLPAVYADERFLRIAIMNIIENAIKYGAENTSVIIDGWRQGEERLRISITDFGIKIEKEDLNKIFWPGYRTKESERKLIEGSGLGLYQTKNLIKLLKGKVFATVSNNPDENGNYKVTFNIDLPSYEEQVLEVLRRRNE